MSIVEQQIEINVDELKHKKLVIATPAYGGGVQTNYLTSVVNTIRDLNNYGISTTLMTLTNESLIPRGRNRIVADFLKMSPDQATHLLFIDSDISFDTIEVIKLLRHDKPVVAGLYPMKSIDWDLVKKMVLANPEITADQLKAVASPYAVNLELTEQRTLTMLDGLLKVKHAATGFLMIERGVFLQMIRDYPQTKYKHDILGADFGREMYALFDCIIDPQHHNYLSEDWTFCKRWTDLGGEVWIDPSIKLQHSGYYVFEGNFLTYLNQVLLTKQ
jgi:hypothetical protein